MAYRDGVPRVTCPSFRFLAILAAFLLIGAACGGSSDSSTAEPEDAAVVDAGTVERGPTAPPAPSATPLVIETSPTSTPVPTPTTPPVALEDPTPSAVLLNTAFTNSSRVTTVGIDELFFGMTPDEAAEAASTTWVTDTEANLSCYMMVPATGPDGVTFWVVDGHIERLDVEHPDIRTRSRMGVGNTVAEIRSQLGDRLSTEELDDGTVIGTFTPSDPGDRDFLMIFEFVDDKVVRYRSGRAGIIQRQAVGCR